MFPPSKLSDYISQFLFTEMSTMHLIKRIAVSQKNTQAKNLATAILAAMDNKKIRNWNKALAEEIYWKAQYQLSARNNRDLAIRK
jgi:hypothetical protein